MSTIYTGSLAGPITRLGPHQFRMIDFALRYSGWHTAAKDRTTRRTLASLVKRRVLVVNEHGQFRYCDIRPLKRS